MKMSLLLLASSFLPCVAFSAITQVEVGKLIPESSEQKVEEVAEGDSAQLAVKDFNGGRYLAATLRAKVLAEEGNATGLLVMGLAYESGRGVAQSFDLAVESYQKGREAGSKEAAYRLARLLGKTGEKNQQKEARKILESMVENDQGEAARLLGEGALRGLFGDGADFEKGRAWWERSASQGNVAALFALAQLFDGTFGFPEKRDPAAALQNYLKAAQFGNGPAMVIAGSRLLNGEEKLRDEKKARDLLDKAITANQMDAYLILGDYAEKVSKNDAEAFQNYLKGAEGGQSECMLKVATFIVEGRAEQEKDALKALAWFKKAGAAGQVIGHVQAARILLTGEGLQIIEGYGHLVAAAEAGLVDVQNEVGLLYLSGRLGVRDLAAASGWFRRSAEGKYPAGAYNLAVLYQKGLGVSQNFDQAGRLFTLAANSGHPQATTALGVMHAEGRGTKPDLPRAWALFSLGAERGDPEAEGYQKEVASYLDEEGMKKAAEILASYQKVAVQATDSTEK